MLYFQTSYQSDSPKRRSVIDDKINYACLWTPSDSYILITVDYESGMIKVTETHASSPLLALFN